MKRFIIDVAKLVIGLWIAKKFVLDNDLVTNITEKLKNSIKEILN